MAIAMSVGFFAAWTPYFIVAVVYFALGNESLPPWLSAVAVLMAKASTVINPLVYFFFNPKYRYVQSIYFAQDSDVTPAPGHTKRVAFLPFRKTWRKITCIYIAAVTTEKKENMQTEKQHATNRNARRSARCGQAINAIYMRSVHR